MIVQEDWFLKDVVVIELNTNLFGEIDTPLSVYLFSQKMKNIENISVFLKEIEELITEYPNRAECYVLSGDIYKKLSDIEEAFYNYELALKCNPNNAAYYAILGRYYQRESRFCESIDIFTNLIENKNLKNYSYYASRQGGLRLISACCIGDWRIASKDIEYINEDFVYYAKPVEGKITKERLENCIKHKIRLV